MHRISILAAGTLVAAALFWAGPQNRQTDPGPRPAITPGPDVRLTAGGAASPEERLAAHGSQLEREPLSGRWEGRVAAADRGRLAVVLASAPGSGVVLPLPDGSVRAGRLTLARRAADGTRRVAGTIAGGGFSLTDAGGEFSGLVQLPEERRAWQIFPRSGRLVMVERRLEDLVCLGLPPPPAKYDEPEPAAAEVNVPVPLLSSRPGADHVLYLDFDGEVVTDANWNFGRTIRAPRARMSTKEIIRTHRLVAGDFAAFDIDVTTDATRYATAQVGRRMRCIITRNDAAAPFAGGVAFLGSFADAGKFGLEADTPCWVFIDRQPNSCAEAISHELGHTLDLNHDGRRLANGRREEYYAGHGRGATGWAPIMGVGYYKKITQWSKGDYPLANNQEDDLALITSARNGFGYRPDDYADDFAGAADLSAQSQIVDQLGVLEKSDDVDVFRFATDGGELALRVKGASGESNADVVFELHRKHQSGGILLAEINRPSTPDAQLKMLLSAGIYFLSVRATGKPPENGNGYPIYGCIGEYRITGKIVGLR
jgi:hypothetical protein